MISKKNIIRLVYIIAFSLVILNYAFEKTNSLYLSMTFTNYSILSIIFIGSLIYVSSSMIIKILSKKDKLKSYYAHKKIKYSREVIKILIITSPILLPVAVNFLIRMVNVLNGNGGELVISILSIFSSLLIFSILFVASTLIAYKQIVKEKILSDEKFADAMSKLEKNDAESLVIMMEETKNNLLTYVEQELKISNEEFDSNINEKKLTIVNETMRSSNPPFLFSF